MPSFLKKEIGRLNNERDQYALETNAYLSFRGMHPSFSYDMEGIADIDRPIAMFYAYIDNFSENFASSWNAEQFYGKTDPIVGFKNTKRTLQVSWKIPSSDIKEARDAYYNLNELAVMLYPSYMGPGAIKKKVKQFFPTANENELSTIYNQPFSQPLGKPPLIAVGWANLIQARGTEADAAEEAYSFSTTANQADRRAKRYRASLQGQNKSMQLMCHVENFTMNPVMEAGFFSEGFKLYPKVWNCSVNLTVQHTHELGRQEPVW